LLKATTASEEKLSAQEALYKSQLTELNIKLSESQSKRIKYPTVFTSPLLLEMLALEKSNVSQHLIELENQRKTLQQNAASHSKASEKELSSEVND